MIRKQLFAYSITAHKDRWAGLGRIIVIHHTAGALLGESEAEALGSAMMQARTTYPAVEGFSNQDAVVMPIPQGFVDAHNSYVEEAPPAPDAALLAAAKDAHADIGMFLSGEWDGKQIGGWEQTLETLRTAITQAETAPGD